MGRAHSLPYRPALPIDSNASERALRVAALGRKNFLFVGTDKAGENLASFRSLIATCEASYADFFAYPLDEEESERAEIS